MTTLTITAKGDKEQMSVMLKAAEAKASSKLELDIIKVLLDHVASVAAKDTITFSIRGQIVVQHLKRNHEIY